MKTFNKIGLIVCAAFVVLTTQAVNYNFTGGSTAVSHRVMSDAFEDMNSLGYTNNYVQNPGVNLFMLTSGSGASSSVAPLSISSTNSGIVSNGGSIGGETTSFASGVARMNNSSTASNGMSLDFSSINSLATIITELDGNTDIIGGEDDDLEKLPGQDGSGGNEPWPPVGDGLLAMLLMVGGYSLHIRRRNRK